MKLDLWSILIIVVLFQGLFLLTLLGLSKRRRTARGNIFLFGLVVFFIWILAEFLAIRNTFNVGVNVFYGTRYGAWFAVGPFMYLYVRAITSSGRKVRAIELLHFVPFIVFVFIVPTVSGESLSNRQVHYGMLSVFDWREKTVTPFEYLYSVIFFLQFIHLGIYLVYNVLRIRNYTRELKRQFSFVQNITWLWVLHGLLFGTLVFASVFLYILFSKDFYRRELDYIYVLPMGLFIYSVAYRLSGIRWLAPQPREVKYKQSSLKTGEKEELVARLTSVMKKDKPYLKNDLRIKDLADQVDMPTHHLSQLINEHFKCSFFDFVNQYRVADARKRIASSPEQTLLQIAFDSGFNNKTSFVNAFKKFEGKTPSAFRSTEVSS